MPPLMVIAQLRINDQVAPTRAALPCAPVDHGRRRRRVRQRDRRT